MIISQEPSQTLARDALSLHWCTCELFSTFLSWCGPVWEPSGCLTIAKAAMLPQWVLSSQQWLPGGLCHHDSILELVEKCFETSSSYLHHNSWIILLFTAVGVVFVFDPLGNPRPQPPAMEPLGVRDMESTEGTQFFSTARSLAVKVWESRLRLLCCCLPQDESHRAAFSSISQLFSGFFSVRAIFTFCLLLQLAASGFANFDNIHLLISKISVFLSIPCIFRESFMLSVSHFTLVLLRAQGGAGLNSMPFGHGILSILINFK